MPVKIVQQPHVIQWNYGQFLCQFQEVVIFLLTPVKGTGWVRSRGKWGLSTLWLWVIPLWKSQSWLTRLFSSFILSSSLSAVTTYRRNTLSLDRFNMDTCSLVDWPKNRFLADFIHNRRDLYCILTLCERWRREDETPHGVSGRGWHRRGQDASVRGGRPRQRAAGPSVCVTAQGHQPGLTTNIWTMIVWLTQTLFWR